MMSLLQEVTEVDDVPVSPDGGWNVGHLADLGVLLSCTGFSTRLDLHNLNILFDLAEDNDFGEVRDHSGRIIEVDPADDGIVLTPRGDEDFPTGLLLDLETLKELGIEQYEDAEDDEPDAGFDDLVSDDIIDEGIRKAYRRSGKRIRLGYRVTSGFRKGRVVSSAARAFRPRLSAATRTKMRLSSYRKRIIRTQKSKMTRRKASSHLLVRLNRGLR